MIAEHFAALKAELESVRGLRGKIFDSARVDAEGLIRDNYVILALATSDRGDGRETSPQAHDSRVTFLAGVKVVGTDAENARAFTDRVNTALIGKRLVVPGRTCTAMTDDGVVEIEPDASVSPPIFFADLAFTFRSSRA